MPILNLNLILLVHFLALRLEILNLIEMWLQNGWKVQIAKGYLECMILKLENKAQISYYHNIRSYPRPNQWRGSAGSSP